MTLEGPARQLFEETKYNHRFPPREKAAQIKGELSIKGLGSSGVLAQQVAQAYVEQAEKVLDDFARQVLTKSAGLGLTGEADIRATLGAAHQQMFDEARGMMLDEFKGGNVQYRDLAMGVVDERRGPVWEHLERLMALRKIETLPAANVKEREQKFGILLSPKQAERDFQEWAEEAARWENPIGVLFVDLDHFKALNERLTHAKVDATIMPEAQRRLARAVQGRGEACRYGGEEFLLVLPNVDEEEAQVFAEKVRRSFAEHGFEVDGETQTITVSIGVAVFPVHGANYEEVLAAANGAALEAKKVRNAVRVATRS